jgi:hypothetical protein
VIASLLFNLSYRRFRYACRNPLEAQAHRLRCILRQAAASEIGRANDFAALARIADPSAMIRAFQDRIPVRSYQEMRADLDAVYAGHWQRLCPSEPIYFAMTAGSSGRFKYVPVTAAFRREIGQASMIFNGALEASYPALRGLKAQFLVGSAEGGHSPTGIPQGFASGFNYKNLPALVRRRFVLPYWVFTIDDADERGYAAGRLLADDPDFAVLCAISPVNLINLRQALERHAERLCDDLEAGTLTVRGSAAVGGSYRGRPDPARAAALRTAWRRSGALPTRLLFPSLQVLVCWQGGNMSYYLTELDRAFGLDRHFEFPVSASEGVFAVPCEGHQEGGALAVTSHFLEFLPDEPSDAPAARALRADELRVGSHYRVVVTNAGGYYRYDMEDVIRVKGFFRRTPVIEFISRKDRQVSVSNERLTERDVTLAMQATSRRCGLWFSEFLFVPCSDRRYRVVIDGAVHSPGDEPEREERMQGVAAELERQLRSTAKGYDFEREDALLEPLQVVVTAGGALTEYLRQRRGDQTLPNAQAKPVHLTNQFNAHHAFTELTTYAA